MPDRKNSSLDSNATFLGNHNNSRRLTVSSEYKPIINLPLGSTVIISHTEQIMSKSQDSKKAVKKEPAKTPKEKKEAKKIKKEEKKRQQ
jgi:hypothetical protein